MKLLPTPFVSDDKRFIIHSISDPHRFTWWRHQMETFSALLAICAGNSPVTGEFPAQRPATWSFDDLFDLHLNKRLSKQSWGWWFETPSRPLWRHYNDIVPFHHDSQRCHMTLTGLIFDEKNLRDWLAKASKIYPVLTHILWVVSLVLGNQSQNGSFTTHNKTHCVKCVHVFGSTQPVASILYRDRIITIALPDSVMLGR